MLYRVTERGTDIVVSLNTAQIMYNVTECGTNTVTEYGMNNIQCIWIWQKRFKSQQIYHEYCKMSLNKLWNEWQAAFNDKS